MRVSMPFISAGCNRHPSAADWRGPLLPSSSPTPTTPTTPTTTTPSSKGLLAYATRRGIALWNPTSPTHRGVLRILKGHSEAVNAVRWARVPVYDAGGAGEEGRESGEEEEVDVLISGGVDRVVRVWVVGAGAVGEGEGEVGADTDSIEGEVVDYHVSSSIEVGGSVNDVCILEGEGRGKGKGRMVSIASADGSVVVCEVWGVRDGGNGDKSGSGGGVGGGKVTIESRVLQTIVTKPRFFPLCVALGRLPCATGGREEGTVLVVGGSMTAIQVYVSPAAAAATTTTTHTSDATTTITPFKLQATLTGHENWIRGLTFTHEVPGDGTSDLLLASASQDKYIRLWRFHRGKELPKQGGTTAGDSKFGAVGRSGLSNKAHRFQGKEEEFSVTFEALLMGHEDWVYTVRWKPVTVEGNEGGKKDAVQLLSASADNSVSIWTQDVESGIWLSTTRLGEISDQKGSSTATGSSGGLWIGLWAPDGGKVAALGRTGSWRLWCHPPEGDRWVQQVATGGHVRDVTGIGWSVGGEYLLTTSLDQTTRLVAKWRREGGGGGEQWHEFSRPQIHGYDINCVVALGPAGKEGVGMGVEGKQSAGGRGGGRFVSGADEKLLRVFEEPKGVAGLLARLAGIGKEEEVGDMPEGADQPVLGLSNKATTTTTTATNNVEVPVPEISTPVGGGGGGEDDDEEGGGVPTTSTPAPTTKPSNILTTLATPPLEDHLSRHTLWPEVDKLYGHGHEISCVAATHCGRYIATACRASSVEHAAIRVYDTRTWREVKPPIVGGHTLSVLNMAFSHDDAYLVSVSRDRSWVVYKSVEGDDAGGRWREVCRQDKARTGGAHARVVFDCAWAPVGSGRKLFATAGRDKTCRLWRQEPRDAQHPELFREVQVVKFSQPVRAVEFLGNGEVEEGRSHYLVVGLEDGEVWVLGSGEAEAEAEVQYRLLMKVPPKLAPDGPVTQIKARPGTGAGQWDVAVSSEDGSVRIFEVGVEI